MGALSVKQILALSVPERMRLIETLWDSIVEAPDVLPVSDSERDELERRLDAYHQNPGAGSPWAEVLKRLKKRG
jgi:putative addiction module component (TIGR02574 family)